VAGSRPASVDRVHWGEGWTVRTVAGTVNE
jgi:hypothetical protein